jgi:hypothetical protein
MAHGRHFDAAAPIAVRLVHATRFKCAIARCAAALRVECDDAWALLAALRTATAHWSIERLGDAFGLRPEFFAGSARGPLRDAAALYGFCVLSSLLGALFGFESGTLRSDAHDDCLAPLRAATRPSAPTSTPALTAPCTAPRAPCRRCRDSLALRAHSTRTRIARTDETR